VPRPNAKHKSTCVAVCGVSENHERTAISPRRVRARSENRAAEAATRERRTMSEDFPRELAIKIDHMLDLIAAGTITPDPFDLLAAAHTLREHGELVRAERCEAVARRLLPTLARHLG
jgi:hypothetical protein